MKDSTSVPFILIANKCDLKDRIVSTEEGKALAMQLEVEYLECR